MDYVFVAHQHTHYKALHLNYPMYDQSALRREGEKHLAKNSMPDHAVTQKDANPRQSQEETAEIMLVEIKRGQTSEVWRYIKESKSTNESWVWQCVQCNYRLKPSMESGSFRTHLQNIHCLLMHTSIQSRFSANGSLLVMNTVPIDEVQHKFE